MTDTTSAANRSERERRRRLGAFFAASGVLTIGEGSLLVLIGPYLSQASLSEGLIGVVMILYGVGALFSRFWSGAYYRTRRAPMMIGTAGIMMAAAYVAIPLVSDPIALAALLALNGAGYSVATTSGLAAVADRHPIDGDAGSVMGWYTGATGAGYAIAGFFAGTLADAVGIGPALMIVALFPAISGLLLAWILRLSTGDARPSRGSEPISALQALRQVPTAVWISFFVAFYISLVNGGLFTFFPIHALAVGFTLTQVGIMTGVHGSAATGIRFFSGPIFRIIPYRRVLPFAVAINAAALMSLSLSESFLMLTAAWAIIGLTRGVLRVASGALVIDTATTSDRERGVVSTIYLAGLDMGKILGPLLAGATAELVGLRSTFAVIGIAFMTIYLVGTMRSRDREKTTT
ncbi:MAG TPA: MFS transporter [Acidimicrobiia bacterium]|nr:MFS transporter [Acidimicrobiia bacterium]